VDSTLDLVHELAEQGAADGTAVVAEEQLRGRGSRGRTWHSPPGGLWYSMLWRGGRPGDALSLRVGLAVADAIERVLPGVRLAVKWPNDLMLGERKVGGVLCEARWQGATLGWIAVGLGINVRNPVPPELGATADRLVSAAPGATAGDLVPAITDALRQLDRNRDGLSRDELERLQARDWLRGRPIVAPVVGTGDGIEPDGRLRVRVPGGPVRLLRAGTVQVQSA